jgi:hypothetical protein
VLSEVVVVACKEFSPIAVLFTPVVLGLKALEPTAVLLQPEVLVHNAK